MKKEDKQEITLGTTVKAVITGYVAYGILIGFIAYMVALVVNWSFKTIPNIDMAKVSIIIPAIEAICIYFIVRWICKLSIYDVFKKCKTNPDNIQRASTRLNLFIILVVAIYVAGSIALLALDFSSKEESIVVSSYQYQKIHSGPLASKLTNDMIDQFEEEKVNTITSTIIIELGMGFALFSIIPYQKKLIVESNEF